MSKPVNHYEVLGVATSADAAAIKRAYHAKMRQYHPDQFIARRKELEKKRDYSALRALDHEVEHAHQQAQHINAAYAILADAARRADYDLQRQRPPTTAAPARYDPAEEPRTTPRQRPHRANPRVQPKPEQFPRVLAVLFIIGLTIAMSIISNFFRPPASERDRANFRLTQTFAYVPAGSTDATATAHAFRPTPTPLSVAAYVQAGDELMKSELFNLAEAQYSAALRLAARSQQATIYYKRGQAQVARGLWEMGIADFTSAIRLDAIFIEAYRERGLLYVALWRVEPDEELARAARTDFAQYLALGGTASAIATAQAELED